MSPTTIAVRPRTLRRRIAAVAAVGIVGGAAVAAVLAPEAQAAPAGCETIRWGFLGSQLRTICDGPREADGGWQRARRVWTPAGYVPLRVSCSAYSCTSTGGYHRAESTQGYEEYRVYDSNVLPDEPGWLPAGSVRAA